MHIKKLFLIPLISIWAILLGAGFFWLAEYSSRPGPPPNISPKFPSGIISESNNNLPKLLLFIHPRCPCSRATLSELAQIVAENQNMADIRVFFYQPDDRSPEWVKTDLWKRAEEIPGVKISVLNEDEIKKFGVVTSGQAILYDEGENLVFSGGITISRGHEGDNDGREAIEAFLHGDTPSITSTPVFGCIITSSVVDFDENSILK